MICLLRNAHEQDAGDASYRLILADHGLYIIEAGQPGLEAEDAQMLEASSYVGFATIGQMDYHNGLLHLDTEERDYRFTFPTSASGDVEQFVAALQAALEGEQSIERVPR